ncbi:uncharacterized protein LOC144867586 [Branchiostoma floridae x Branchiostoma japonicum]
MIFIPTDQNDRKFNSTTVTNTTITVRWIPFREESQRGQFQVKRFYFYRVKIVPPEIGTDVEQSYYNETHLEAIFTGLTPGKEYEIQQEAVGDNADFVFQNTFHMRLVINAIISTDPSPVEKVSVVATSSTSVTLNLVPPKKGFVALVQVQATSKHHSSPLVVVPFPEKTPVQATLSNLRPETAYSVSATTVANGRRGQANTVRKGVISGQSRS